jgi:hypothetical protein
MSFECITEIPGFTQEKYDEVRGKMGLDTPNAQWPQGLIHHCAGPLENGTWCIVEEWETREDFQRFCDSQPKDPQMLAEMGQIQQRWFPVYNEYHSPWEQDIGLRRAA